jgi:hypothetical protein
MNIAEKLTIIAENEQKVYDAGKQSEYDRFWDTYQDYGKRTNYGGAFFGIGWNNETFKPKYDIFPSGSAINLFRNSNITGDLKKLLDDLGIALDTSQTKSFEYSFFQSTFESLPLIDMSYDGNTAVTLSNVFAQNLNLKKLPIKVSEYTKFTNVFAQCTALQDLQIAGTIGQNGFSVSDCKSLTKDSMLGKAASGEQITNGENLVDLNGTYYYGGIISALKDCSDSNTSYTVTLGTTNLAKLTDSEKAIATQKGWTLA